MESSTWRPTRTVGTNDTADIEREPSDELEQSVELIVDLEHWNGDEGAHSQLALSSSSLFPAVTDAGWIGWI